MHNWTPSQLDAINSRNTNLLVSAAAGSGKTAAMVERIFSLISTGNTSIDKFLVVTFTNAAASSMREKLVKRIESALKDDPNNSILLNQQRALERANICTIHSLCIDLLRRYYFCTPLPPDFRIIDSAQNKLLSASALEQAMENGAKQFENGNFPEYKEALTQFMGENAKNDSALNDAVLTLHKFLSNLPETDDFIDKTLSAYSGNTNEFYNYILDDFKILLGDGLDYLELIAEKYRFTPIGDSVDKYCDAMCEFLSCARGSDSLEQLQTALKAPIPKLTFTKKQNSENADLKEECKCSVDFFKKHVLEKIRGFLKTDLLDDFSSAAPAVKALLELTKNYDAIRESLLLKEGGTDFSGVLHYTVKLLKEHEDVLNELKENTDYIFVDEFQDTNILQSHILEKISTGNNMFFVGDVKQSIYGFLSARPDLFIEKMQEYGNGVTGKLINFSNNFRSYSKVLDGVNFIFENIMSKAFSEIDYDKNARLYPTADTKSRQYSDCLLKDGVEQSANDFIVCEKNEISGSVLEGEAVASYIKELLNCTVFDRKEGVFRPIRYNDIAILGRDNKTGDIFKKPLEKLGIPYVCQQSAQNNGDDILSPVISLLRLIVCRRCDLDLITVLLSCIGNFSHVELSKIRTSSPSVSFYDAFVSFDSDSALKQKIDGFISLLDKLELLQQTMSLADFIEYVYNETNFIYYAAASLDDERDFGEINSLVTLAQGFSNFSGGNLRSFIKYYEARASIKKKDGGEHIDIDESDNSVHYMTIHKSKGLEYPVVILVHNQSTPRPLPRLNFDEHLGIGFELFTADKFGQRTKHSSIISQAILRKKEIQRSNETTRLLYVALTRAMNKLAVFVTGGQSYFKARNVIPHRLVWKSFSSFADLFLPLMFNHKDGESLRREYSPTGPADYVFDQSDWQIKIYDEATNDFTSYSPSQAESISNAQKSFDKSAFLSLLEEKLNWQYEFQSAITERTKQSPSKKGQVRIPIPLRLPAFNDKEFKGAQKGTAVHYFMEHFDFKSSASVKEQSDEMFDRGILSKQEFDALPIKKIEAFINSEFGARMKNADNIFKERSFCLVKKINSQGDEALVQGIIDCYFFEGSKIILLDYKTDFIKTTAEDLARKYAPQLDVYKEALEKFYPECEVVPYIHFFNADKTICLNDI